MKSRIFVFRAAIEQELDHRDISVLHSRVQRRNTVVGLIADIYFCAHQDASLDVFEIVIHRGLY